MSVSVQRIRPDPRLSVEETAFLRERAFPLWCDEGAFANQEVAQAKALFRRVFSLGEGQPLKGFLFEDALTMFPPSDRTHYYTMVVTPPSSGEEAEEPPLVWMHAVVTVKGFDCVPHHLPFGHFLAILSTYAGIDEEDQEGAATTPTSEEEEDSACALPAGPALMVAVQDGA